MSRLKLFLPCLLCLSQALVAAENLPTLNCNQLGREIALRAAEQLTVTLDAGARTELAALATTACLEYAATSRTAESVVQGAAAVEAEAAADAGDSSGQFELEFIEPGDRVRRPGLKRR